MRSGRLHDCRISLLTERPSSIVSDTNTTCIVSAGVCQHWEWTPSRSRHRGELWSFPFLPRLLNRFLHGCHPHPCREVLSQSLPKPLIVIAPKSCLVLIEKGHFTHSEILEPLNCQGAVLCTYNIFLSEKYFVRTYFAPNTSRRIHSSF